MLKWFGWTVAVYSAVTPAMTQAAPSQSCEVAVWTAPDYRSQDLGMMVGGALGAIADEPNRTALNSKDALARVFPPDELFKLVQASTLPKTLGANVDYVHVSKDAGATKLDRKRDGRSLASTRDCYIEVYFDILNYQSSFAYGSRMFDYVTFKDFRSGKLVKSFGYHNQTMPKFAKQTPEVGIEMLRNAVVGAFNSLAAVKLSPSH